MTWSEPAITINGHALTIAQAMAVRVAVSNFLLELSDPENLEALGPIGPEYQRRLVEITKIMFREEEK